jgi:hypothetical protein
MPNYLICDNCQHKNAVNSERMVFCKGCNKKLSNNYLDWKKTKFNSSFETYVEQLNDYNDSIPLKTISEEKTKNKKSIFKTSLSSPSKKSVIFITSVLIQLLLVALLTQNQNTLYSNNQKKPEANYLNNVKWGNYSITQNLALTLPFELKESESVLPNYMHNYIENDKSRKAETSQSFSVTIEKMEFNSFYKVQDADLISVNDKYMKSPGITILKDEGFRTIIKGYKTYFEHGSYILNGNEYLYENYTLTKGNEGVKIILSYLKNDDLLCKYAGIVTQSLLNNKQII